MLRSFDSWIAVAMPIVAARAGSPRCTEMAAIVAAFAAWSGASECSPPSTVAVQRSVTTTVPPNAARSSAAPVPTTATAATATTITRVRRPLAVRAMPASVGVQRGVELDRGARSGQRLDGAGGRVPPEEHVGGAGQLDGLDRARVVDERDLGPGGHVQARL